MAQSLPRGDAIIGLIKLKKVAFGFQETEVSGCYHVWWIVVRRGVPDGGNRSVINVTIEVPKCDQACEPKRYAPYLRVEFDFHAV